MGRLSGMRVLLIDNYSSFTQNVAHYLEEITGEAPVILPNDYGGDLSLAGFQAIVLSPGPGTPHRHEDLGMCRALLEQGCVSVLGICLGHQGVGVLAGADLGPAETLFHGRTSAVTHEGDALFAGIPRQFEAARYHSLILRDPLPSPLQCIARTERGEIMAVRHLSLPQWGVQFHPESVATQSGHRLFANFLGIALSRNPNAPASRASSSLRRDSVKRQANCRDEGATRWGVRWQHVEEARLPSEFFETMYGDSKTAFWLDGEASKSISYLGDASGPYGYRLSYDVDRKEITYSEGRTGTEICENVFAHLERLLAQNRLSENWRSEGGALLPFEFLGGLVGYLGYELKKDLGARNRRRSPWPDAEWIWVTRFVAYHHAERRATLISLAPEGEDNDACEAWLSDTSAKLRTTAQVTRRSWRAPSLAWRDRRGDYRGQIESCQQKIRSGDSYEMCLTTVLAGPAQVDALELFRRLRTQNPAPYAAYLCCTVFQIASSSPERFLRIDSQGRVESRPIKGTAPRSADVDLDRERAIGLVQSEKDRAENLMIVDLVRHDLAQVCKVGSVEVTQFAGLESYSSVHQLVSTVRGELRNDKSALAAVAAAFPGGSMTGAPKKRSMEILDELETGPRGPYSGSLGYLSMSGSADLSIVIRSVVVERDRVSLGVGGAITALSESEDELEEVELKALASVRALHSSQGLSATPTLYKWSDSGRQSRDSPR